MFRIYCTGENELEIYMVSRWGTDLASSPDDTTGQYQRLFEAILHRVGLSCFIPCFDADGP